MTDTSLKITHAVPSEVQRVLDAMTEENWQKGALGPGSDGRMCFLGQARRIGVVSTKLGPSLLEEHLSRDIHELNALIKRRYCISGDDVCFLPAVSILNDTASSLSDFKQKIVDLYRVEK